MKNEMTCVTVYFVRIFNHPKSTTEYYMVCTYYNEECICCGLIDLRG